MERGNLEARNSILDGDLEDAKQGTNKSTVNRRCEQRKNEQHVADFEDVKRYLSLKIRDKQQKIQFYQDKLRETRQERENHLAKLQAEFDQLKQAHELEHTQLNNQLKASKQRRDALATVSALEIQLKREIEDAEQTLKREKAQQSQQLSLALADYYMLHVRHEKELSEGIQLEWAKNRRMMSEHLEHTVIAMMREIDSEIKKYSTLVLEARHTADVNSQLMKLNKQRCMERDLLQREADAQMAKIAKNDMKIRKLVEELRAQDQKLAPSESGPPEPIPEEREEPEVPPPTQEIIPEPSPPIPDRERLLQQFFENAVDVLCNAIVKILGVVDPIHSDDYVSFHGVFRGFEGRKKELRFLMSKLGNVSFHQDEQNDIPEVGFTDIEGVDEDVAVKKIVEPQRKAFLAFGQPVGPDEFPDLIATHFFQ
jgi:chromosome segregation ATPase